MRPPTRKVGTAVMPSSRAACRPSSIAARHAPASTSRRIAPPSSPTCAAAPSSVAQSARSSPFDQYRSMSAAWKGPSAPFERAYSVHWCALRVGGITSRCTSVRPSALARAASGLSGWFSRARRCSGSLQPSSGVSGRSR